MLLGPNPFWWLLLLVLATLLAPAAGVLASATLTALRTKHTLDRPTGEGLPPEALRP